MEECTGDCFKATGLAPNDLMVVSSQEDPFGMKVLPCLQDFIIGPFVGTVFGTGRH